MEAFLFFVGIVGNVISVLVFAAPMTTFWRVAKKRSTERFEVIPYVVTLLGSSLWVYYGLIKTDGILVATVNAVGVILETIYVSLFIFFSPSHLKWRTAALVAVVDVGVFGAVLFATLFGIGGGEDEEEEARLRVMVVGIISACLNIGMYASPLSVMNTVISTKSVEFMPFFLSFTLFLNGGVWLLYSVLDKDVFLGIPNGIGFLLGIIQLFLYAIYMNSQTSKQLGLQEEEEEEEECQHLIQVSNNQRDGFDEE